MLPQVLDIPPLEAWGDMLQAFGDIALVKGLVADLMDECFHFEQQMGGQRGGGGGGEGGAGGGGEGWDRRRGEGRQGGKGGG